MYKRQGYASPGELRYAVVRLLYMLLQLPYADRMAWYPRAQVDFCLLYTSPPQVTPARWLC